MPLWFDIVRATQAIKSSADAYKADPETAPHLWRAWNESWSLDDRHLILKLLASSLVDIPNDVAVPLMVLASAHPAPAPGTDVSSLPVTTFALQIMHGMVKTQSALAPELWTNPLAHPTISSPDMALGWWVNTPDAPGPDAEAALKAVFATIDPKHPRWWCAAHKAMDVGCPVFWSQAPLATIAQGPLKPLLMVSFAILLARSLVVRGGGDTMLMAAARDCPTELAEVIMGMSQGARWPVAIRPHEGLVDDEHDAWLGLLPPAVTWAWASMNPHLSAQAHSRMQRWVIEHALNASAADRLPRRM